MSALALDLLRVYRSEISEKRRSWSLVEFK
jgi:hypothetical protein